MNRQLIGALACFIAAGILALLPSISRFVLVVYFVIMGGIHFVDAKRESGES